MKQIFAKTLAALAKEDKTIFLLTGDLGFSVFEDFIKKFPDRFFDIGVAEQNMIGIAAGLSLSGKKVFVYSIIPFLTMRCFEQIRNDLCYQNLDVKLIGTGSGLSYGTAGMTHHALEDIAIMRALSNMIVICPCGPVETEMAIRQSIKQKGPVYLRLGKGDEPVLSQRSSFKIGKAIIISEGRNLTLISSGSLLPTALETGDLLSGHGLSARIVDMHTIKPIDKSMIIESAKRTGAVFTIEEHSVIGGLGSAVSEVVAEAGHKVTFKRFGVLEGESKVIGSQKFMLKRSGLTPEEISKQILRMLK